MLTLLAVIFIGMAAMILEMAYGHAPTREIGTRSTRSPVSLGGAADGAGAVVLVAVGAAGLDAGLPPSNAPKPRPRTGFAMHAE